MDGSKHLAEFADFPAAISSHWLSAAGRGARDATNCQPPLPSVPDRSTMLLLRVPGNLFVAGHSPQS
eukprot:scaffold39093_cov19-Prasinocladus_malaysianus.AAC.1